MILQVREGSSSTPSRHSRLGSEMPTPGLGGLWDSREQVKGSLDPAPATSEYKRSTITNSVTR